MSYPQTTSFNPVNNTADAYLLAQPEAQQTAKFLYNKVTGRKTVIEGTALVGRVVQMVAPSTGDYRDPDVAQWQPASALGSITMNGDSAISIAGSPVALGGAVTITHNDTAVVPGTYGSGTSVASVTVDQKGHVTGAASVPITDGQVVALTPILVDGGGLSPLGPGDVITLSHANSGVVTGTYGSSTVVPVITVSPQGHITLVTPTAITFPDQLASVAIRNWGAGDGRLFGVNDCVVVGDTASTAGGTRAIAIGSTANAINTDAIAVGYASVAANQRAIALGAGASSTADFAGAIGPGVVNTVANTILIGTNQPLCYTQPTYQFLPLASQSEGCAAGQISTDPLQTFLTTTAGVILLESTRYADGGATVDLANDWLVPTHTQQKYTVAMSYIGTLPPATTGTVLFTLEWWDGVSWLAVGQEVQQKVATQITIAVSICCNVKTNVAVPNRFRGSLVNGASGTLSTVMYRLSFQRDN